MAKKQVKISRNASEYWQYLKKEVKRDNMEQSHAERSFRKFVANRSSGIKRGNIIDHKDKIDFC